jgi:hypothetical protein
MPELYELSNSQQAAGVTHSCNSVYYCVALCAPLIVLGSKTSLASPGQHCHSTLSLAVIGCHSFGIYTIILPSFLSFHVKNVSIARG